MSIFSIFLILIILVSFLLVLVIMVQNPKGGGLSSSFGGGGSQMLGGVKETGNFLDKSTWALATILIVLILISNMTLTSGSASTDSKLLEGENTESVIPETSTPERTPTANDSTQAQ